MLKKILIGTLTVLVIVGLALGYFVYTIIKGADQLSMQYDNEVISTLKTELDFSPFEEALSKISEERMNQIQSLVYNKSIEEIQYAIADEEVSCEEILLYYIDRIKKYDSRFNTVISLNPEALIHAKALDERLKMGEDIGYLAGVMFLIKDNISDIDTYTTAGAYALKDLKTTRDAFVVQTIKEQDGIIIGKNNMSEWANFISSPSSNGFSVLGGQTKNAYGRFDVGGSSSGSASSTALNFCTVSLGSETAGSMIYPSSQNSVVGIKPSIGMLSRDLVIPISEAQDTVGIVARSTEDARLVLSAISKYDQNDSVTSLAEEVSSHSTDFEDISLKGKRVLLHKSTMYTVEYEMVKKELEGLGADVIDVEMVGDESQIDMMTVLNYGIVHDVEAYLNNPAVESRFKTLSQIYEYNSEDYENRVPYGMVLHEMAIAQKLTEDEYNKLVESNRSISSAIMQDTLDKYEGDFIISISNELSGVYAPAGYPAITVPAGYKSTGEPFGLTIVGRSGDDYMLLGIATAYEKETTHRIAPKVSE